MQCIGFAKALTKILVGKGSLFTNMFANYTFIYNQNKLYSLQKIYQNMVTSFDFTFSICSEYKINLKNIDLHTFYLMTVTTRKRTTTMLNSL